MPHKRSMTLLALNVVGAAGYDMATSSAQAIPQERAAGIYSITGEPVVWFAAILPIISIFFAVNVTWGTLILARRQWHSGRLWLLSALVWLIAMVIDFAHH